MKHIYIYYFYFVFNCYIIYFDYTSTLSTHLRYVPSFSHTKLLGPSLLKKIQQTNEQINKTKAKEDKPKAQ